MRNRWWVRTVLALWAGGVFLNLLLFLSAMWNHDQMPGIGRWKVLSVLTGSMSPAIEPGDLIVVSRFDRTQPEPGDIVTFREGSTLVTHRVVQRLANGYVQTKGDANTEADGGWTDPTRIVGKVVCVIPFGAVALRAVRHPLALAAVVLMLAVNKRRGFRPDDKEAAPVHGGG